MAITCGLLSCLPISAIPAQAPRLPQPKFKIAIHANAEGGPHFTLTNLTQKTLTACVIEFSRSTEIKPESSIEWDPIIQTGPVGHPEFQQHPLAPNATMSMYMSHVVGVPLPDTVEIIAGIWDDGETFGDSIRVKRILEHRCSMVSAYEQAIALLQKGLDENWTRDQYLEALTGNPSSMPSITIRRNLQSKAQWADKPRLVQLAMKHLLVYFTQNLATLRQQKPPTVAMSSPSQ